MKPLRLHSWRRPNNTPPSTTARSRARRASGAAAACAPHPTPSPHRPLQYTPPVLRRVLLITTALFLAAAAYLTYRALDWNARFHDALTATPASGTIDLSTPGAVTLPFRQTFTAAHGQGLYVLLPTAERAETLRAQDPPASLGHAVLRDAAGETVDEQELVLEDRSPLWDKPRALNIASLRTVPPGDYTLELTITSPTPNPAPDLDEPLPLVAYYQLCGLEQLPTYILGAGAVLTALVALLCGLFTIPLRRRPAPPET